MDAFDVLCVSAEVRRVVDLVLEQNAGDFVGDEVWWLDCVGGGVEEVVLEGADSDCELQVSAGFEVGVADCMAPEFEGVGGHGIFGGGLFVFAVEGFVEAVGP